MRKVTSFLTQQKFYPAHAGVTNSHTWERKRECTSHQARLN